MGLEEAQRLQEAGRTVTAPLPETGSLRAETPTQHMEEMVEETMHKLTGQTHDNFDISEKIRRKGGLNIQNIYRRAPTWTRICHSSHKDMRLQNSCAVA